MTSKAQRLYEALTQPDEAERAGRPASRVRISRRRTDLGPDLFVPYLPGDVLRVDGAWPMLLVEINWAHREACVGIDLCGRTHTISRLRVQRRWEVRRRDLDLTAARDYWPQLAWEHRAEIGLRLLGEAIACNPDTPRGRAVAGFITDHGITCDSPGGP